MSMPIDELNKWLNSDSTQEILSYNQTKLLNIETPGMIDYVDEKIHG